MNRISSLVIVFTLIMCFQAQLCDAKRFAPRQNKAESNDKADGRTQAALVSKKQGAWVKPKKVTEHDATESRLAADASPVGLKDALGSGLCGHVVDGSLTVPASVEVIEAEAFSGCKSLSKVTFAEHSMLKKIGAYAFHSSGLTAVTIPASVEEIDANAFFPAASWSSAK